VDEIELYPLVGRLFYFHVETNPLYFFFSRESSLKISSGRALSKGEHCEDLPPSLSPRYLNVVSRSHHPAPINPSKFLRENVSYVSY